MRILVFLRQVPRLRSDTPLDETAGWIDLSKAKFDPNSYDLFALEAALRLTDASQTADGSGEVVVVSAGPKRVVDALKSALEIGAHRAIHVFGDCYEAMDSLALARVFRTVCESEKPDLVLTGFMSDDGNAAALGPMLAELADFASATGIVAIEATAAGYRVERELEGGAFEVVDLDRPALATVQSGINEVRYPSLKDIVAARKKRIDTLELPAAELPTSATSLLSVAPAGSDGAATLLAGSVDEIVSQLVAKLDELRVL